MKTEQCGLWFKVLSKKGMRLIGMVLFVCKNKVLNWWKYLSLVCEVVGIEKSGCFQFSMYKKVEDDSDTYFWCDNWLEGGALCERFNKLIILKEDKLISVADIYKLGRRADGLSWKWRRNIFVWEENLILETFNLQENVFDTWIWKHNHGDFHSVKAAYHLLTMNWTWQMTFIWHHLK